MRPMPDEEVLAGSWIRANTGIRGDAVCERIEWLVNSYLRMIAASPQWGDWETLFQDPNDGRYWERTYPHGELQGGGPPKLQAISAEAAKAKYDIG